MARVKRREKSLKEQKEWLEQKTANRRRNHEGASAKRAATRERERLRQDRQSR